MLDAEEDPSQPKLSASMVHLWKESTSTSTYESYSLMIWRGQNTLII